MNKLIRPHFLALALIGFCLYLPSALAAPLCSVDGLADCWDSGTGYSGAIHERYPIQMQLKWDNENVRGYMFYESTASYLMLEGVRDSNGHAVLKEKDKNGNNTGIFEGALKNEEFFGEWSTSDGKKNMPFKLTAASGSAAQMTGDYACDVDDKYVSQSTELSVVNGVINKINFVSVAGKNAHICELHISDLRQESAGSYLMLVPGGEYEKRYNELYGDLKERIKIQETANTVSVQFFGNWRAACGLNGLLVDVLINKKTKKCKIINN